MESCNCCCHQHHGGNLSEHCPIFAARRTCHKMDLMAPGMKLPAPWRALCEDTHFPEVFPIYTPAPEDLSPVHHKRCRFQGSMLQAEPGSLLVCPSVDEDCAAPGVHFAGLSVLDTEYMSHLLMTTPPPWEILQLQEHSAYHLPEAPAHLAVSQPRVLCFLLMLVPTSLLSCPNWSPARASCKTHGTAIPAA